MRRIFLGVFLVLIGIAVLVGGCSLNQSASNDGGVLELKIGKDFQLHTITPPISDQIRHYNIYGTGPDGASFVRTEVTGGTITVEDLAPGIWTVRVEAVNIQGYIIAEGSDTDTVIKGQVTTFEVTVVPLSGPGELGISLSWPADLVTQPSIVAEMRPVGSDVWFDLTFDIEGSTADYVPTAPFDPIYNGYYAMTIQLKDGESVVWGAFEAVRIMAFWKSEGSFPLTEDDITPADGDVDIIIDPDLQNPIDITFSGNSPVLGLGSTMDVTAIPDPEDPGGIDGYVYEWYLNGVLIPFENLPAITIGDGLGLGNYRLDVAITYGSTVSSNYVNFSVVEPTDNVITARVEYTASDLTGADVYVNTFSENGNLPDDRIESGQGVMEADYDVDVVLDRVGAGYLSGTYGIRAHIDADATGTEQLTSGDFIAVGEVIVAGSSVTKTIYGPWGGSLIIPVYIDAQPLDPDPVDTDGKQLYVVLVASGDSWGNYAYGEAQQALPSNPNGVVFGTNAWAPYGQYSFLAVIDMDDTEPFTGVPETGDFVYTNEGIIWSSGDFPEQRIDSWTKQ